MTDFRVGDLVTWNSDQSEDESMGIIIQLVDEWTWETAKSVDQWTWARVLWQDCDFSMHHSIQSLKIVCRG